MYLRTFCVLQKVVDFSMLIFNEVPRYIKENEKANVSDKFVIVSFGQL